MSDPLDGALDLLRRLPPTKIKENIQLIIETCPGIKDDLLSSVDQPLVVQTCKETGKEFLLCDYNRDGTSYRSPWGAGEYQPKTDGYKPSAQLRKLEVAANDAFQVYRDLYFGNGVSSCFFWELEQGFAAAILIKKVSNEGSYQSTWDSTHVFQVTPLTAKKSAEYKLTSSIMLQLAKQANPNTPNLDLGGNLTRQAELEAPVENFAAHVHNLGRMVEEMENKMRNTIQEIYFGKTRDIVNDLRSMNDLSLLKSQQAMQAQLLGGLKKK